ncbi:MAG TPA: carbon-nitrogen hydrolase family protein [Streptosporangiaceae bacterium]|nr:carbon-nitrogen hydrolase family protein [Streptosporangiaceae bacterium]
MRMPVAVAQVPVCWSVPRNLETILAAIEAAGAGTLLVLPEAALSGYDDQLSGLGDLSPAELAQAREVIGAAARDSGVHVIFGTLLPEHGQWWNAAVSCPPAGRTWVYRKVNLATHERGRLAAGAALPTLRMTLPAGGVRAGVQLCREIRFPEQWHCLARQGAQVLIYLTYAANPAEPPGVWRAHLISRAAETQRFVLAANVAHGTQHCPTVVVSPRGQVLAEALAGTAATLELTIDLADVKDTYLHQQRDDVVSIAWHG